MTRDFSVYNTQWEHWPGYFLKYAKSKLMSEPQIRKKKKKNISLLLMTIVFKYCDSEHSQHTEIYTKYLRY